MSILSHLSPDLHFSGQSLFSSILHSDLHRGHRRSSLYPCSRLEFFVLSCFYALSSFLRTRERKARNLDVFFLVDINGDLYSIDKLIGIDIGWLACTQVVLLNKGVPVEAGEREVANVIANGL